MNLLDDLLPLLALESMAHRHDDDQNECHGYAKDNQLDFHVL
jgi:hypothetical protein